jgi:hypothetical protein
LDHRRPQPQPNACYLIYLRSDFLSWLVFASFISHFLYSNCRHDQNNAHWIEESLKLLECPHSLQQTHIQDLDIDTLLPVIQWLTSRMKSTQELCIINEVLKLNSHFFNFQFPILRIVIGLPYLFYAVLIFPIPWNPRFVTMKILLNLNKRMTLKLLR